MLYLGVFSLFSVAAYFDWRWRVIPNAMSAAMLLLGLAFCLLGEHTLSASSASAVVILTLLAAVCFVTEFMGNEGIGGGDIKLMTAAAFTLGLSATLVILLLSSLMAAGYLLLKKRASGQKATNLSAPMAPFFLLSYLLCLMV